MPYSVKHYTSFFSGLPRIDFARASLILIGLAWVLPFLQTRHRAPIPSFYSEWWAFALSLLALLALLRRRHWQPMTLPRVLWVPLALAALLLLQMGLGRIAYPQQALLGTMYLIAFALLCWLGQALRDELGLEPIARVLSWSLLAGGTLSALIALIQHFGWHGAWDGWVNASAGATAAANLGQVNHFADYAALALGALGYLWAVRRVPGIAALPLALLLLAGLALSGSRSGWLYLAVFVALAWLGRGEPGRRSLRGAIGLLLLFALVQGLLHMNWVTGATPVVTPTERLFGSVSGVDERLALWGMAWRMFLDAPVLGVGFGQFAHALFERAIAGSVLAGALYNHAHNLPMQLLAELGAVGLGVVAWGLGAWLLRNLHQSWNAEQTWLRALLGVLLIHSLLEYPLWYAYFLGIAAFLIGAGETHTMRLRVSGVARTGFGLMLALATVSLIRIGSDYLAIDRAVILSRQPEGVAEVQATLQRLHRESLLAPYIEYVYAFGIELDRQHIADKLDLNTQVMRFAPTRDTVYRQATLLELADQPQAAQAMQRRAQAMYPAGPGSLNEMQQGAKQ